MGNVGTTYLQGNCNRKHDIFGVVKTKVISGFAAFILTHFSLSALSPMLNLCHTLLTDFIKYYVKQPHSLNFEVHFVSNRNLSSHFRSVQYVPPCQEGTPTM